MIRNIKEVTYGKRPRKTFSKINDEGVLPIPNLIEVQKDSYNAFINEGIREVFDDFSPITDFSNHFELRFLDHTLEKKSKFNESECRLRDATYAAPLKINVRLTRKDTGEIQEQEVFMGDFPLMTETGSFIINGAERVVVSQLVRSPGVYIASNTDKNGATLWDTTVIPNRGAWLEFVHDSNNILHVHVDRNRKLPSTVLLRAIGVASDKEIRGLFNDDPTIRRTCEKDSAKNEREGLIELYKRLRPGEVPTDESIKKQLNDLLFDSKRYDLARVGRYKFNKKLSLANRIEGFRLAVDVVADGEVIARAGEVVSEEKAYEIQHSGVNVVFVDSKKVTASLADRITDRTLYEDVLSGKKVIAKAGTVITEEKAREIELSGVERVLLVARDTDAGDKAIDKVRDEYLFISDPRGGYIAAEDIVIEGKVIARKDESLTEEKVKAIQEGSDKRKLLYADTITGRVTLNELKDSSGNIIATAGERLSDVKAEAVKASGIKEVVYVEMNEERPAVVKVIGNGTVDIGYYLVKKYGERFEKLNPRRDLKILEYVNLALLKDILDEYIDKDDETLYAELRECKDILVPKHITKEDIIATVSLNLDLKHGMGEADNIDHLGNRRVRSVGELLQNQFRVGIARLERVIKERMAIQEVDKATPQSLINVRPVSSAIKEFFGSSQLSQYMDQSNPIAELTHKRKLSALGPGGLNRERATFDVRDVHHSHYGRMCPIETPEGQNIGLISSLATYARVNEYGFIESPYRKVDKVRGIVTKEVHYLAADEEDKYIIAQANEPLDEEGRFVNERVQCRQRENIAEFASGEVDFMDVSPKQLVSVATSLIPFLENDDTNRALMGSNMQRQAVPILMPEAPIVATGVEHRIAYDSGVMVISRDEGTVSYVSADKIVVKDDKGAAHEYALKKFVRSNQGTCINQRPIAHVGDIVKKGDILADGHSTEGGELALGRNILIGFMSWEGYNYEDAILISERLVKEDIFTSIHIEEFETETRDTKLGPEEFTRDIPNTGEDALKDLDEEGIIRIGAEVRPGDILVGKVTPKGETELSPEERLLRAIFSEKAREVRDTSLRVPNGEGGVIVDIKIFTRENKDELDPGVNKLVRVYIAQKRKLSIGDKMAGRHGNKGVISRILPEEDMPFMEDGTPLQIVLNPMGVPSRMNIGQVLEVHLGLVAKMLGWKVTTPVFDGATEADIRDLFQQNCMVNPETGKVDGKVRLFDGRTGTPFENRVTVGYMYMLKLIHLVDDKIHARSTGPYSLVTQQPLGGKAQFGGQRFGEMEVWALEAYGASNILQEILTVKSDDVVGRVKTFESIIKGTNIAEPGIPESFKVLIKEMQSLCLDVKVLGEDKEEIIVRDTSEDEQDMLELTSRERAERKDVGLTFDEDDSASIVDDTVFDIFETDDDEKEEEFDFADLLDNPDEEEIF